MMTVCPRPLSFPFLLFTFLISKKSPLVTYDGNFVKCDNADINSMSSSEVKSTIIADQTVEKSKESEGTKHILSNAKDVDMDAVTTAQPADNCERQEDAMDVDSTAENNVDMEDEYKGHTETLTHPVNTGQEDSFNSGDHTPDTKGEDTASTANNIPADQILTEKSNNNPATQEVTGELIHKPAQATVDCNNPEGLASLQTTKEVGSISHNIGGTDQDSSSATGDSTAQIPESSGPTPDTNLNPVPDNSKIADSSGLGDSYSNTVPGLTGGKNPAETVIEKALADQVPEINSQNSVATESDTDNLGDRCVSSTLGSNIRENKNIAKPDSFNSNKIGDRSDSLKTDQARSTWLSPTPGSKTSESVDNQNSARADHHADNLGDNQNSVQIDIHNTDQVKTILRTLTPDNKLEESSEPDGEKKEPSAEDKPKETDTDTMGQCFSSNNSADEEKACRMSTSKTIVKASPRAVSLMATLEGLFHSFSHWICWRFHLLLNFFQKDPNSSTKKNKKGSGYGSNDNSGNNHNSEKQNKRPKPNRPGDRDTEKYRKGYPGQKDDEKANANWLFYNNEIQSEPDGAFIDDIHQHWKGDYKKLERHHGYIQWLFPIREHGMNHHAQPLQLHEAEKIKSDQEAMRRVLKSYRLMLDFYGMELVDESTGKLKRSDNYKECFHNLSWSSHNYLRITRILKSLGELGYEHLKKPFLEFVLHEALKEKTLTKTLSSCESYWIGTVKNDDEREELYQMIEKYKK
ncbi:uncharacterized protein LOC131938652 isoform X2 [Physella acuta]|uniref:uncharacterized protein LOC131938652 isoform X2 n=1 Tax=Physella acuta TaxID=109671 RepID=UPI0027DD9E5F|nr:uncharacterized protein LOC131938652 isoform X2 [Physella acuta]